MNFYGLLIQFTKGTTPSRKHLLKHHSSEIIDKAIDLGYIVETRRNTYNEPVYAITNLGKEVRDK